MTSLMDADKHIFENQFEKCLQSKRNYDIWTCPVTAKLALLYSGYRLYLKAYWILFTPTPPNYYNDFEHAVSNQSCIYCYFSVLNLHLLHIARVETKSQCCFAIRTLN